MSKSRTSILLLLALAVLMVFSILLFATGTNTAPDAESAPETDVSDNPQGLLAENGNLYYYNADGTLFTGGLKEVTVDGSTERYFFQEDGTAFTDGYKEISLDGKPCHFYFLANGQAFNSGYKTVMIDGKKHYFFFGSNGQAVTNQMESIPFGDRTAYMLFTENGKAFTDGYKEVSRNGVIDYYYFLGNGQAFNSGYKTVTLDDVTYYFYFENDGKAFTGGLKDVSFGSSTYSYFFQKNGRARTSVWETLEGTKYYFQSNGRAAKSTFATIDGNRYYFGSDYAVATGGWFCVDDGYYYADSTGKLSMDTVVEGYKLDANGKSATKYRIIQLVEEHTDPSMSEQEKIDALYYWLLRNDMKYIRSYEHAKADWVWKDSWADDMATRHLDNWGGNCYTYAALSGFLFREATGLDVKVYQGRTLASGGGLTYHGWTSVYQDGDWYVYDVELHKHSGVDVYNCHKSLQKTSYIHLRGEAVNLY